MSATCPFGKCDGSGKIRVDENSDVFCDCLKANLVAQKIDAAGSMGYTIRTTDVVVPSSPLCGRGSIDRTGENLLLRGFAEDYELPHLKRALFGRLMRNMNFRFVIANDERIKNVWVGNESYGKRSRSRRDEMPTVNALRDLIGEDCDLAIIYLGVIEAKNVEMPRILKEALLLRASFRKGTWLIEKPHKPFDASSNYRSWDNNVSYYVDQRFEVVELSLEGAISLGVPSKPRVAAVETDDEASFFGPDPVPEKPKDPPKPKEVRPPAPERASEPKRGSQDPVLSDIELDMPQALLGDLNGDGKRKGWKR